MKLTTVIVDDEPPARERIRRLLKSHQDIDLIGECANGREAIDLIHRCGPDLLFLDIQMPELDGFGLLAALETARIPAVIFVTAYDQFAVRAFEVHAIDYLLKPFDRERFDRALQRAIGLIKLRRPETLTAQLSALLRDLNPRNASNDRLAVKSEGRLLILPVAEIDWIEASDNYVVIHAGDKTHLHRETLTSLQTRLEPKFARIQRSALVNLDKIRQIEPLFHGDFSVLLQNGTRLTLTRNFRPALNGFLSGPGGSV